ncbi:MAG: DUF488 domain-containing protein [Gaiella sp.]|nr:DUF488 domain-containing protein [Gaiella sp.]
MNLERVATIGVYGFDADRFFAAVLESRTDLFCDLRARRGVRGREYAFANARRLEQRLGELGIAYRHFPELAPTKETRSLQRVADEVAGTTKRVRGELAPAFVDAYERQLDSPDARAALEVIEETGATPLLFCVERTPAACHRSLAASRLAGGAIPIDHLLP